MPEDSTAHRPFADEGELTASLAAIRNQIAESDRRQTERLDRIEAQTTKTNGRVTANGERLSQIELWRAELRGASSATGIGGRLFAYVLGTCIALGGLTVGVIELVIHWS